MENSQILEAALKKHPDMLCKLTSFVEDYGLPEKPALIWQCQPKQAVDIDVTKQTIHNALQSGADTQSGNAWWYEFKSYNRPKPVFDGLAAYDLEDGQEWMTEFHTDGHIIAGIWNFIETEVESTKVKCVADFYADAFTDFGVLAAKLRKTSEIAGECFITCTLLNATELAYCPGMHHNHVRRISRQHLQWKVRHCRNSDQIADASSLMATEFMRAYGYFKK